MLLQDHPHKGGLWLKLSYNTVNSLYSGHCRDLELVSSFISESRVHNSGIYFGQASVVYFAAVLIIGVSVIAGSPLDCKTVGFFSQNQ